MNDYVTGVDWGAISGDTTIVIIEKRGEIMDVKEVVTETARSPEMVLKGFHFIHPNAYGLTMTLHLKGRPDTKYWNRRRQREAKRTKRIKSWISIVSDFQQARELRYQRSLLLGLLQSRL